MLIRFYIRFSTKYGESLHISLPDQTGLSEAYHLPLTYLDEYHWEGSIRSEAIGSPEALSYSVYFTPVTGDVQKIISNRTADIKKIKQAVIEIYDGPSQTDLYKTVFSSVPFREIIASQKQKVKKHSDKNADVIFRVEAPLLEEGKMICITGASKKFKGWNERKPLLLQKKDDVWSIKLDLSKEQFPFEYKFGVYDTEEKKIVSFEPGLNRIIAHAVPKDVMRIYFYSPELEGYKWKGSGVNIPVSAIRTEQTWGFGSFTTLHLLIDWARKTGVRLIQLLPVNDTSATLTSKDSYPYAAISAFALHPLYLNVQKLATAFGVELSIEKMEKIHAVNALDKIDYEEVYDLKMNTLRELYDIEKQSFKDDYAWFEFFDVNRYWLVPYAAFCFLRDKYRTADFSKWQEYSKYDESQIQELVSPENKNYDAIALHYFIQYHLHLQLKDASAYAHKHNVILKGDLPIGVGRFSVDTWMFPELFHMNMQAGAPPDAFSSTGQNWGFPTYNWEAMANDGYAWWRKRMEHMGNYFDAVRIDHVLGFYRIWSIPHDGKDGITGKFIPSIPLSRQQFQEAGVVFDEDRLCKPFVNEEEFGKLFAERASWVTDTFFYEGSVKQEFDTQEKIAAYFSANPLNADLEKRMLNIVSNVILLPDTKPGFYHFRINMQQGSSYKGLPDDQREKLDKLYHKYFFEIQNDLWKEEGRKKLGALKDSTDMLLCAEDLGMVPDMVEGMLAEMQILSLQVQRMPKTAAENFSNPANASYLSVVTPATHDMSTIREWWEDEQQNIQYFYNYILARAGEAPKKCEPLISKDIILQHLHSPAMWSIFLLQDLLGTDAELRRKDPITERINDPAEPEHNWDYRMHITMEDLLQEKDFNNSIKKMIRASGR